MQPHVSSGGNWLGGIIGYPLDDLFEEVAFVAYHFHWPLGDILSLEHADRQRFIEEISGINRKMNDDARPSQGIPLEQWDGNL